MPRGCSTHSGFVRVRRAGSSQTRTIIGSSTWSPRRGGCGSGPGRDDLGSWTGPGDTACFYEPGGLSATGRHVYVADTNNHAVRVVSLASGEVQTLGID